jgi:hypothetical protein
VLLLYPATVIWFALYNVIQPIANWIACSLLAAGFASGESLAFFFYDGLKIILLLGGMIFLITMLRSFFSAEQTRAWLGGKREGAGNEKVLMTGHLDHYPKFFGIILLTLNFSCAIQMSRQPLTLALLPKGGGFITAQPATKLSNLSRFQILDRQ